MKLFVLLLATLGLIASLLLAMAKRETASPGPDCTSRVIITRTPSGEPLECVCIGGTLASCFNPGP